MWACREGNGDLDVARNDRSGRVSSRLCGLLTGRLARYPYDLQVEKRPCSYFGKQFLSQRGPNPNTVHHLEFYSTLLSRSAR